MPEQKEAAARLLMFNCPIPRFYSLALAFTCCAGHSVVATGRLASSPYRTRPVFDGVALPVQDFTGAVALHFYKKLSRSGLSAAPVQGKNTSGVAPAGASCFRTLPPIAATAAHGSQQARSRARNCRSVPGSRPSSWASFGETCAASPKRAAR